MAEIFNLANYSYNFNSLPYFILSFIALFFGIFVFISNRRSLSHIGYSLMCLNFFTWMFFVGLSNLANDGEVMRFWLNMVFSFFGGSFISVSTYCFSVGWLEDKRQEKFILPFYFSLVPFAILAWIDGLLLKGTILVGTFFGYPFYLGYGGSLFLIFIFWWLILALLALVNIYKAYRVENLALIEKKRRKFMLFIFFIGYVGSIEWLPWLGINIIYKSFYPVGNFIVIVMTVGVAFYGILKYQLLDIRVVVKKAFFYSLGIALISGFVAGITFLNSWFIEVVPGFNFWVVPLFVGIAAFVVGNLFWRKSKQVEMAYEAEKRAYEELKKLNQAKDEFILITQHHLRTPLTIMKGYLDVVLNKFQDKVDPKALEYIDKVAKSTNRLTRIVNEFLDIAQFQIGKGLLKIEPTNIFSLIKEVFDELQPEIEKKKLFVKINPEPKDWPLVSADPQKFKQALFNIIDNAIKYTPGGGITVTLKKYKDKALLTIEDTGIGLSTEDLKHLFVEVFERSKEAKKVFPVGRGVGLFVTARIIKIHQGRIWAESEGPGKGTRFIVEMPLSKENNFN